MVRLTSRNFIYTLENVYFPSEVDICESTCDITKYNRFRKPVDAMKTNRSTTCYVLITDLRKSAEDILSDFSRTTKQQIRKCIKEESVKIAYFTCEALEKDERIMADFKRTYMSYCEQSNKPWMKRAYSDEMILRCIEQKCILVTKAEFPNGEVYHLYLVDDKNSYLLYIASNRLNAEVTDIISGMANKLLIYKGMLWLKEMGIENYELGDISDLDRPDSIERFKLLFGGTPVKVYNYYVANTIKGKVLIYLKKHKIHREQ